MRRATRQPVDLAVAAALPVVLAVLIGVAPAGLGRALLALPVVIFLPGYALAAILFPRFLSRRQADAPEEAEPVRGVVVENAQRGKMRPILTRRLAPGPGAGLDPLERVGLSFGLSLAVVPLLGLALNFSPTGVRLWPVVVVFSSFILVLCLLAWRIRLKLPVPERPEFRWNPPPVQFAQRSLTERLLLVAAAAALLVGASLTVYLVSTPRAADPFTEFYILGPGGKAEGYPTQLNVSEPGAVIIGIVNREHTTVAYNVTMTDIPARLVNGNATLLSGGTVVWARGFILNPDTTQERDVSFTLPQGYHRLQFDLRREGDADAYRTLHLWVQVGKP